MPFPAQTLVSFLGGGGYSLPFRANLAKLAILAIMKDRASAAFSEFINASNPVSVATMFRFEHALKKEGIVYQKIAFY